MATHPARLGQTHLFRIPAMRTSFAVVRWYLSALGLDGKGSGDDVEFRSVNRGLWLQRYQRYGLRFGEGGVGCGCRLRRLRCRFGHGCGRCLRLFRSEIFQSSESYCRNCCERTCCKENCLARAAFCDFYECAAVGVEEIVESFVRLYLSVGSYRAYPFDAYAAVIAFRSASQLR